MLGGLEHRNRVRSVAADQFRGLAVRILEDRDLVAHAVRGGCGDASGQTGSEVGDDVSEQVAAQQHIELVGVADEPHAEGIHDDLVATDVREVGRHRLRGTQEEAVRLLHDVRLVDDRDALSTVRAGVLECESRDALQADCVVTLTAS